MYVCSSSIHLEFRVYSCIVILGNFPQFDQNGQALFVSRLFVSGMMICDEFNNSTDCAILRPVPYPMAHRLRFCPHAVHP